MRSHTLLFAAFLTAAGTVSAQRTVCVRGFVENARFGPCLQTVTTRAFNCAGLLVDSRTINMPTYQGQYVEVCGTLGGTPACPLLQATSIRTPVDHLRVSGAFRPGGQVSFDLGVTPARFWVLLMGTQEVRVEVPPFGMLLVDPPLNFGSGVLPGSGNFNFQVPIPNDPALVNAWIHFQGVFVDLSTVTAEMGNSDCFQIQ